MVGSQSRVRRRVWAACLLALCSVAVASDPPETESVEDLSSLSLEDLMNVEVTSVSKHAQKAADAPAAITVITQDDIQRSNLNSIPELLRLAPGMDVARLDDNQWAVSSRGFNDLFANKLLVLMDGRTVYTPLFSGVFWDMQDYVLTDLDRIEVIRGPGATLWGSNAVNGVINIETKSARDTQGFLVRAEGGNEESAGAVRYGGQIDDKTYFRVFTKYRDFQDFPLSNGDDAHDGWQSLLGGVRVDRYTSDHDTLTFEANGYGSRYGQMLTIADLTPPAFRSITDRNSNAYDANVLGRWTHVFSAKSDLAVQMYYDHLNRDVAVVPYSLDTFDIDFHHRFPWGERQEITWGAGYRLNVDDAKPAPIGSFDPRRRDLNRESAFVQDDIEVVPERVHVIVGTKMEVNTYTDFEVQPSGRVLWTPNETNTVWGAISRATRIPSRLEADGRINFSATPVPGSPLPALNQSLGNPNIDSETLTAYEIGYRVRPTRTLSLDLTGFFNDYDKLDGFEALAARPDLLPPSPHLLVPLRAVNNLTGESYGAELAANWKVTDALRLAASYTFLTVQIHHERPEASLLEPFLEQSSPRNQFQVHSYWDVLKNLQLNAGAYYVERLGIGVPSYVRVDLGLTWRPRENLDVTLGVQNLFDNQHFEYGGTRTTNVIAEVPRTYFGQLTWKF